MAVIHIIFTSFISFWTHSYHSTAILIISKSFGVIRLPLDTHGPKVETFFRRRKVGFGYSSEMTWKWCFSSFDSHSGFWMTSEWDEWDGMTGMRPISFRPKVVIFGSFSHSGLILGWMRWKWMEWRRHLSIKERCAMNKRGVNFRTGCKTSAPKMRCTSRKISPM